MSGNVQPIPAPKPLPPEIAAIAVPQDGDVPNVFINETEEAPRSIIALLRPDVYVPLLVGLAAEYLARLFREHRVVTASMVTAVATASVITGAGMVLDSDRTPLTQPPPVTVPASPPVTVTLSAHPPVTVTATPSVAPTTSSPAEASPRAESTRRPPVRTAAPRTDAPVVAPRTQEPQPRRSATRSQPAPTPLSTPSTATDSPSLRQELSPDDDAAARNDPLPATRDDTPASAPTLDAGSSPSAPPDVDLTPEPGGGRGACTIRVDVDPLLDLCLLG